MLDKFNSSTYGGEQTSVTGSKFITRQYSPRVAILGSHGLESEIVKISDEPSNTVLKQT